MKLPASTTTANTNKVRLDGNGSYTKRFIYSYDKDMLCIEAQQISGSGTYEHTLPVGASYVALLFVKGPELYPQNIYAGNYSLTYVTSEGEVELFKFIEQNKIRCTHTASYDWITYYSLAERGHTGYFNLDTGDLDDDNTSSFELYTSEDEFGSLNPYTSELYEKVTYTGGSDVIDTYNLKNKSNASSMQRYVRTLATDNIKQIDITPVEGKIVIENEASISPVYQGWWEVNGSEYIKSRKTSPFTLIEEGATLTTSMYYKDELDSDSNIYYQVDPNLFEGSDKSYKKMTNLNSNEILLEDTVRTKAQASILLSNPTVAETFNI